MPVAFAGLAGVVYVYILCLYSCETVAHVMMMAVESLLLD